MRDFLAIHAALIVRLARLELRATGSVEPADVAQEVILGLLRSHREGAFDPARLECPEAYLRVVVRHAVKRALARSGRGAQLTAEGDIEATAELTGPHRADSAASPEEATARARDARRRLEALKQRLRPRDAVAFALLVEDGMSMEEVAAVLGTTLNNVYQMRHRIQTAAHELSVSEEARPARVSGGSS